MQLAIYSLLLIVLGFVCHGYTIPELENARQLYKDFKLHYGKNHANQEDEYRFQIFKENLVRAKQLQLVEEGSAEYGVTEYSDLTPQEFQQLYLGLRMDDKLLPEEADFTEDLINKEDSFDWRLHGAVGPVLDQGRCGSCWAFSTVGNIEGQWFRKTGKLLQLSEQQVVDCDKADAGCHGGWPPQTYGEIKKMGGLQLNADYPYKAQDGKCKMDPRKFRAYVNGSYVFPPSETYQSHMLQYIGPLASALNAKPLQFYRKGILRLPKNMCPDRGLNHAVLTVGYGTEKCVPYWIVKNSWSARFGEQGYFRIFRGDNTCGIAMVVSTAIVK